MGLDYLSKIDGPYILVDGQDSHSMIGSFEVFKESDALFMLKHSLLKDRNLYNEHWVGGRYYWGKSEDYGIVVKTTNLKTSMTTPIEYIYQEQTGLVYQNYNGLIIQR
jgi:hypothetical protein